jgi:hypothetical protein
MERQRQISDLEVEIEKLESELGLALPEPMSDLRETHDRLAKDAERITKDLRLLTAEFEGMGDFLKSFPGVPLLDSLVIFLRIQAKVGCLQLTQTEKEELLDFCDLCGLVFGGFATIPDQAEALADQLLMIESGVERGELALDRSLLQSVTPISLDYALSPHFLRAAALRAQRDPVRATLARMAGKMKAVLHPAVMQSQGAAFAGFVASLREAITDLNSTSVSFDKYAEGIEAFVADRCEPGDIFTAFFQGFRPPKPSVRVEARDGEKAALRATIAELEAEIPGARAAFEKRKAALAEATRRLKALEDQKAALEGKSRFIRP